MSATYEKHVPIDYVITNYVPATVIIHVDDGLVNLKTVLSAGFTQTVIGMYFPTVDGTIVGVEPSKEDALEYLYAPSEHVAPISISKCTVEMGTAESPFPSKAAADRFQRDTGHRYQKGDSVHYVYKREVFSKWQW